MRALVLGLTMTMVGLSSMSCTEMSEDGDSVAEKSAQVEQVQPQDPAIQNSDIVELADDSYASFETTTENICYWNDKKYSDGGAVCEAKRLYVCWPPKWIKRGPC